MNLIEYIKDVNILLIVLDVLLLIISFLFFNQKGYGPRVKDLFVIGYTLTNLFLFSYFNSIFQGIFTLKYLAIKIYLIVVLINLFIFLYTFNKKIKLGYKIINYLLVILISFILIVNIYVVVSEKLNLYNLMDIDNSIILMNISCIIFGIYLVLISLIYIGYYLYDKRMLKTLELSKDEKFVVKPQNKQKISKKKSSNKKISKKTKNKKILIINKKNKTPTSLNEVAKVEESLNIKTSNINQKTTENNKKLKSNQKTKITKGVNKKLNGLEKVKNSNEEKKTNTLEALLAYKAGDSFYINGIDCSIIFCDSQKENIVRNYEILKKDIEAKLVNGYTLKENLMMRDICNKLKVSNLGSIDINNFSILNVISVDEYMFLKKILD